IFIWINYRLLAVLSVIIHDSGLGKRPTARVPKKGQSLMELGLLLRAIFL
ncbi:hypothetical protein N306_07884, partial [Opisthocomus hoazin]